jgi:diguanylate cyclase (GGDEF)-like protein/PAS domain S-box-containing protein
VPGTQPATAALAEPPETSLRYLDGLMRHSGGVMYVRDAAESRFLMVNQAFADLVGLASDQIIGRTGYNLFPGNFAEVHRANDLLVLADGVARTSTEWAPHPDGTVREFVSHKFPLFDGDGKPYAIGGISTDVTDLQASELARRDTEARFRAVFDRAPVGQIFSELGGGVSAVNEALAAMLGYQPEQMLGRRIEEFAEREEFTRLSKDARTLLEAEEETVTAIRRFLHADGHTVPVRVTSFLLRDEHSNPRCWVSMAQNLSEEERTRAELERAHGETVNAAKRLTLLNAVAGAANDAVALDNAATRILGAVCRHFGWQRSALLRSGHRAARQPAWILTTSWSASAAVTPAPLRALANLPLDLLRSGPQPDLVVFGPHETDLGGVVVLPLSVDGQLRYALMFLTGEDDVDVDDLSLLRLIALESTRLVERQVAGELLATSEQRFRSIFAGSPLPMALLLGNSGRFSAVNDALCQLVGRTVEQLVGQPGTVLAHPDDAHLATPSALAAAQAEDGRQVVQARMLHASGAVIEAVVTLTWMDAADGSRNLLAQMEDVTARRAAEDSLRRQAEEDPLTGLANRAYLNRLLMGHASAGQACAVLFIDLDGFKLINDSCGHEVGDEVLIEVAQRLRSTVRPTDAVARLGGDEFVVLCPEVGRPLDIRRLAQRISEVLESPILTTTGAVRVTASVGIADGEIPLDDPTELLHRADIAMYRAKRLGKDRSEFYDADLHRQSITRSRTETALRTALDDGRFTVHYQPIVNLVTGEVKGFEALVRLVDEAGGIVSPEHFIAVAEQSGLIVPLGSWVMHQACQTLSELRRSLELNLFMAVNISASQVSRPDLISTVTSAISSAGLPQTALALELTESSLLEADSRTLQQLNLLRSSGVQIALDDFGTGYSSLAYLRTFPVSHIKIDRSFISGIAENSGDLAIVRAIAGLATDLGLGCVAEGVETEQQRQLVAELGVPSGQGYLFARPVGKDELYDLMLPPAARAV